MQNANIQAQVVHPLFNLQKNTATGYQSIFATKDLAPNTVLMAFHYNQIFPKPTRYSVQIGENQHISLQPNYLQYINHSCDPNILFDTAKKELRTLKPILAGEEISFFYPSTEWAMTEAFDCGCGKSNCLGSIQGTAYLSTETAKKYKFSDFIQQKWAKEKEETLEVMS